MSCEMIIEPLISVPSLIITEFLWTYSLKMSCKVYFVLLLLCRNGEAVRFLSNYDETQILKTVAIYPWLYVGFLPNNASSTSTISSSKLDPFHSFFINIAENASPSFFVVLHSVFLALKINWNLLDLVYKWNKSTWFVRY